jgi:hypothetical protein
MPVHAGYAIIRVAHEDRLGLHVWPPNLRSQPAVVYEVPGHYTQQDHARDRRLLVAIVHVDEQIRLHAHARTRTHEFNAHGEFEGAP